MEYKVVWCTSFNFFGVEIWKCWVHCHIRIRPGTHNLKWAAREWTGYSSGFTYWNKIFKQFLGQLVESVWGAFLVAGRAAFAEFECWQAAYLC